MPSATMFKDRFVAALLALLTGAVGGHRFYLRGSRDVWGWLHPPALLLGLYGVWRFVVAGQSDALTWGLLGVGAALVIAVVVQTLVIGLTADEAWDARWNAACTRRSANGWGPVLVVVFALFTGVGSLTGALAYVLQRYFGGG
jgi:hypothetical protein